METFVKSIKIKQLKGLRDVEITFKEKGLTGILGPNGSGKTSILHALACLYHPYDSDAGKAYFYPDFFLPTYYPDNSQSSNWTETHFEVSIRSNGVDKTKTITKAKKWRFQAKSYKQRDKHFFSYLGLSSALPDIEQEKLRSIVSFRNITLNQTDDDKEILSYASYILGKRYAQYETCKRYDRKSHIGVKANDVRYCALSMGSGEQRVFRILQEVFRLKRKPSSLLLIDELDILLHQQAVVRLVEILHRIVENSNNRIQIIFTTHNHSILSLDYIEFRHLFNTGESTLCFSRMNPQVLINLTGVVEKMIEIYVEDILSSAIVMQLCNELGIRKFCEIKECGTNQNVISAAQGMFLHLGEGGFKAKLFVLDGDEYVDADSRLQYLNKLFNGSNAQNYEPGRRLVSNKLRNLIIPSKTAPEYYYSCVITSTPRDKVQDRCSDCLELYDQIVEVKRETLPDHHEYLKKPIRDIYGKDEVGFPYVAKLLSITEKWETITSEVKERIESMKKELGL